MRARISSKVTRATRANPRRPRSIFLMKVLLDRWEGGGAKQHFMFNTLPVKTGITTPLERTARRFKAYNHKYNLLPVMAESQF